MSEITLKADILPTFKPIDQPRQKRKIVDISSDDSIDSLEVQSEQKQTYNNKRSKAGDVASLNSNYTTTSNTANVPILSKAIAKSAVWIAATLLMQDEKKAEQIAKETKDEPQLPHKNIAAFSVYHGLEDSRNITEKVVLTKDQNLNDVYVMGVIRMLDQCKDDSCDLIIHTGCALLHNCLDKADETSISSNEKVMDQIRAKIAERIGTTSFTKSGTEEDEFKAALKMAEEKLSEQTDSDAQSESSDEEKSAVTEETDVDAKDTTEDAPTTSATLANADEQQQQQQQLQQEEVRSATELIEETLKKADETTSSPAPTQVSASYENDENDASMSWGSGLSLKSFFDLFKPFKRSKKN